MQCNVISPALQILDVLTIEVSQKICVEFNLDDYKLFLKVCLTFR